MCLSNGVGISPVDLQAADGPDHLSGCVCDVLLHTQHTLVQVNIFNIFEYFINYREIKSGSVCILSQTVIKSETDSF